jgi:hypothetical protein
MSLYGSCDECEKRLGPTTFYCTRCGGAFCCWRCHSRHAARSQASSFATGCPREGSMLLDEPANPSTLRDQPASPGGH